MTGRYGSIAFRQILARPLLHCARCSEKCMTPIANHSHLDVPMVVKNVQTGTSIKVATAFARVAWGCNNEEGCEC